MQVSQNMLFLGTAQDFRHRVSYPHTRLSVWWHIIMMHCWEVCGRVQLLFMSFLHLLKYQIVALFAVFLRESRYKKCLCCLNWASIAWRDHYFSSWFIGYSYIRISVISFQESIHYLFCGAKIVFSGVFGCYKPYAAFLTNYSRQALYFCT